MNDSTAVAISFRRNKCGVEAIEYALLVSLVAVVAVGGGATLGEGLSTALLKTNGAPCASIISIAYSDA